MSNVKSSSEMTEKILEIAVNGDSLTKQEIKLALDMWELEIRNDQFDKDKKSNYDVVKEAFGNDN